MPVSTASTYGADSSGLICGFRFGVDGRGVPIGAEQALAWLAATAADSGFVWLHFNLAHAATEKWLRDHVTHTASGSWWRSSPLLPW